MSLYSDTPPPAEAGYRIVPVKQGGGTAYIRVKDAGDPYKNVKDSDGSGPEHFSFGMTSNMAHKTYDTGDTASSHDDGSYQKNLEHTFLTKSYFDGPHDVTLPPKVPMNSAAGYSSRASGFDKTFLTANADVGQNKMADYAMTTSSYQGRTAVLGGHEVKKFASSMSSKTYEGPEAEAVKRDLSQMNDGLLGIKDMPNRPLTIDEVRALINHGVKPEADEKPPVPSKALNDPDYTPDPAPPPLRAQPGEDRHLEDDSDMVPSPGTMAHGPPPEDSEPLPQ
jgi:hypothetical protein